MKLPNFRIKEWDDYYLALALLASRKSKDPVTKVGCILVSDSNKQLAMGYNGFLPGVDESNFTWEKTSPNYSETKYAYVLHAEQNAILHCDSPLQNATAYVTLFPCNICALFLAKEGIKRIVYLDQGDTSKEYYKASVKILKASNITTEQKDINEIKRILSDFVLSI